MFLSHSNRITKGQILCSQTSSTKLSMWWSRFWCQSQQLSPKSWPSLNDSGASTTMWSTTTIIIKARTLYPAKLENLHSFLASKTTTVISKMSLKKLKSYWISRTYTTVSSLNQKSENSSPPNPPLTSQQQLTINNNGLKRTHSKSSFKSQRTTTSGRSSRMQSTNFNSTRH